jgi:hypothetical protein
VILFTMIHNLANLSIDDAQIVVERMIRLMDQNTT